MQRTRDIPVAWFLPKQAQGLNTYYYYYYYYYYHHHHHFSMMPVCCVNVVGLPVEELMLVS
jgi:hypothetical protein